MAIINGKTVLFSPNVDVIPIDNNYNPESENAQSGVAVAQAVNGKVDKVNGKGLSTNDYSNADKSKVDGAQTKITASGILKGDGSGGVTSATLGTDYINAGFARYITPEIVTGIPIYGLQPFRVYKIGKPENDSLTLNIANDTTGYCVWMQIDFYSGETPTNLTVTSTAGLADEIADFVPEANKQYSLYFDYGAIGWDSTTSAEILGWRMSVAEYTKREV